ncbi:hypothetical protein LJB42_004775 [Komagataella kurtzmanii]|nr:hypothetical protein LJB42_004775 [Komagataella kurtzmanii]
MSKNAQVDDLAHGLAGAGGGILSMIITYPLLTLSTHAQSSKTQKPLDGSVDEKELELKKSSTYGTLKRILKKQGVRGLYNGLESAILGIAVNNFIYYYFYELTGNTLEGLSRGRKRGSRVGGLSAFQSIVAGAIAGVISRIATNPIWVANTRMTVLSREQRDLKRVNTLQAILYIFKTEGFKTLFSGLIPALFLVLNPIIHYTIFEQLKTLLVKTRKRALTPLDALLLGAFGKLISTVITYPYVTLRTRMHLQNAENARNSSGESSVSNSAVLSATSDEDLGKEGDNEKKIAQEQPTNTIWGLSTKMLKEEGISSFYSGMSVKLSQSILSAAFLFFFKEELVSASDVAIKAVKKVDYKSFLNNPAQVVPDLNPAPSPNADGSPVDI